MKSNRIYLLALLSIFAAFLPAVLLRDFNPLNELSYLAIASESMERGSFFAFYQDGSPYADKPPLYLWICMLCLSIAGQNAMPLVLLASVIPFIFVLSIMDRYLGVDFRHQERLLIILGMCSLLFVDVLGVIARMDMLFTAVMLLAYMKMVKRYTLIKELGPSAPRPKYGNLSIPLLLFLGVFTKGPYGFIFPVLSLVAMMAFNRDLRRFFVVFRPYYFIIILLMTALWAAMVYLDGGKAYVHNLFIEQSVRRVTSLPIHREPFYYYLQNFVILTVPVGLCFVYFLVRQIRNRETLDIKTQACLFFTLTTVLVISIPVSKLEVYMLPAIPAAYYYVMLSYRQMQLNARLRYEIQTRIQAEETALAEVRAANTARAMALTSLRTSVVEGAAEAEAGGALDTDLHTGSSSPDSQGQDLSGSGASSESSEFRSDTDLKSETGLKSDTDLSSVTSHDLQTGESTHSPASDESASSKADSDSVSSGAALAALRDSKGKLVASNESATEEEDRKKPDWKKVADFRAAQRLEAWRAGKLDEPEGDDKESSAGKKHGASRLASRLSGILAADHHALEVESASEKSSRSLKDLSKASEPSDCKFSEDRDLSADTKDRSISSENTQSHADSSNATGTAHTESDSSAVQDKNTDSVLNSTASSDAARAESSQDSADTAGHTESEVSSSATQAAAEEQCASQGAADPQSSDMASDSHSEDAQAAQSSSEASDASNPADAPDQTASESASTASTADSAAQSTDSDSDEQDHSSAEVSSAALSCSGENGADLTASASASDTVSAGDNSAASGEGAQDSKAESTAAASHGASDSQDQSAESYVSASDSHEGSVAAAARAADAISAVSDDSSSQSSESAAHSEGNTSLSVTTASQSATSATQADVSSTQVNAGSYLSDDSSSQSSESSAHSEDNTSLSVTTASQGASSATQAEAIALQADAGSSLSSDSALTVTSTDERAETALSESGSAAAEADVTVPSQSADAAALSQADESDSAAASQDAAALSSAHAVMDSKASGRAGSDAESEDNGAAEAGAGGERVELKDDAAFESAAAAAVEAAFAAHEQALKDSGTDLKPGELKVSVTTMPDVHDAPVAKSTVTPGTTVICPAASMHPSASDIMASGALSGPDSGFELRGSARRITAANEPQDEEHHDDSVAERSEAKSSVSDEGLIDAARVRSRVAAIIAEKLEKRPRNAGHRGVEIIGNGYFLAGISTVSERTRIPLLLTLSMMLPAIVYMLLFPAYFVMYDKVLHLQHPVIGVAFGVLCFASLIALFFLLSRLFIFSVAAIGAGTLGFVFFAGLAMPHLNSFIGAGEIARAVTKAIDEGGSPETCILRMKHGIDLHFYDKRITVNQVAADMDRCFEQQANVVLSRKGIKERPDLAQKMRERGAFMIGDSLILPAAPADNTLNLNSSSSDVDTLPQYLEIDNKDEDQKATESDDDKGAPEQLVIRHDEQHLR
ncbi:MULTISPECIES: hypothetical protein [unclassified Anaerobiospirillum]|uniref:hypothetical protein n=1 Tax=unclassified Anaerobiospirillum TaxID=2647410 RepID=UPI001FF14BAF|nr:MULTISPECIES: hypothetical protein [unclassified Anaerobiospirillum]MCK0534265.1 hypothetical protein [Anaerobiospirillum sp. NML120511]MCK0539534.1 hypothetical protein [Anaerobiospirillum sp. NML02-A-032]